MNVTGAPKEHHQDAEVIRALLAILAMFGAALSVGLILGSQLLTWLKTGNWPSLTLANFLPTASQNSFWMWMVEPHSWLGLHSICKLLIFDLPLWIWVVYVFSLVIKLLLD